MDGEIRVSLALVGAAAGAGDASGSPRVEVWLTAMAGATSGLTGTVSVGQLTHSALEGGKINAGHLEGRVESEIDGQATGRIDGRAEG